jgi:Tfp pilus assembly protein PilV
MKRHTSQQGFFLLEVVIASAVIATTLILLLGSIQNSVEVSQRSLERTRASFLLEEGAEAVKSIRDANWTNLTAVTVGTPYYLLWSNGAWTLTQSVGDIDGYTRTIVVEEAYRDGNNDIAASGAVDANARKVTVSVSWTPPTGVQTETLQFYIFNIR